MKQELSYEEARNQLPAELRETADLEINLTENVFYGEELSNDEYELLEKIKQVFTR